MLEEALIEALGAERYKREEGRAGWRNGKLVRRLVTGSGEREFEVPRGRLYTEGGGTQEWRSDVLERFARRTPEAGAAMLATYLGGVNTRKVKAALRPLLGGKGMSRSAVSRIVGKTQARFEGWSSRSLAQEDLVFVFLDGFALRVRVGGRVESVPVLGAMGVCSEGRKVLLAVENSGSESKAAWEDVLRRLEARGPRRPLLCIVDGNPGLRAAVEAVWPEMEVQRCTVHKLRNLLAKAPRRLHDEIRAQYHAFVDAKTAKAVRAGYQAFLAKWQKRCPGVAKSLREAGEELLTSTRFPRTQWKCLRTTNAIERLNGEFRRRVKTQASFPNEKAAVVLLFALLDEGLVRLRQIDGWRKIAKVLLLGRRRAA